MSRTPDLKKSAEVFKAFCDENRLRIIRMLTGGEKCACEILDELSITQPTLSHHMKILCDSGIVTGRKDGKWTWYTLSEKGIASARNCLEEIITQ